MNINSERKIHDRAACLEIMLRFEMPAHVIRHSEVVAAVALYLARRLNQHGYKLDLDLVRASGLLHDITKKYSFTRPLNHSLTGAKLLKKLGYPEVAGVVGQHVRLRASRPAGLITEAEVVNYSDKRVVNDAVTTLAERLAYIQERYGRTEPDRSRIEQMWQRTFQLEQEIFRFIPGGPDQLLSLRPEPEESYEPAWAAGPQ